MSYTALYRKYRPTAFSALMGQEHIARTLVNQIEGGAVGHAYLFAGSRGTGKTSAARIFARAVNCEKPVKGSPCYKCATCRALSDPANLDITEIDAASNNRVDEIRDLREKVKYPPISGKYKVYIVDEAHMLTDSAFNALLKTLEEPPPHAVFILATTEAHKLPATILSRCMRFDFRLLGNETLMKLMRDILDDIKKEYDEDALAALAAAGGGSVRDMLSVADMCVSFSKGRLTAKDVSEVLGAADTDSLYSLTRAVLGGDAAGALGIIDKLLNAGKSPAQLGKDLTGVFRNLLVIKTCGGTGGVLYLSQNDEAALKGMSAAADFNKLFECAEGFARLDSELRYGSSPRVSVEMLCLKLAGAGGGAEKGKVAANNAGAATPEKKDNPPPAREIGRAADFTTGNASPYGGVSAAAAPRADTDAETPRGVAADADAVFGRARTDADENDEARKLWGKVVRALRMRNEIPLYAVAADKSEVTLSDGELVLSVRDPAERERLNRAAPLINEILTGTGRRFRAAEFTGGTGRGGGTDEAVKRLREYGGDKVRIEFKK